MSVWSKAFRFTAMFLLLFTAVEVFACDLLPSDGCYISSHSPNRDKDHKSPSGDTCLCCCQHMAAAMPFRFAPQRTIAPAPPDVGIKPPLFPPSRIEHPPQLS
uniref:DUF2946 domain-containing protein n=1 Tax=mine drainage metagenome TaxID=410659 RepID=E6PXX9_9ZZZZ